MPVLRYFVVAGAALLALLFLVSSWLPSPAVTEREASGLDKTTIRINGEKPVIDRVIIDTSVPVVTPPVAAVPVAEPSIAQSDAQDDLKDKSQDNSQDNSRRDALARMEDTPSIITPEVTPPSVPVKKVVARKHPKRPAVAMTRPAGLFDLW